MNKEQAPRTRIVKRRNESYKDLARKGPRRDRGALEFQCPECGYSGLNVYQQAWMVTSDAHCVCKYGIVDYGLDPIPHFEEALFECARCAYRLTDAAGNPISNSEGLASWLQEHPEL